MKWRRAIILSVILLIYTYVMAMMAASTYFLLGWVDDFNPAELLSGLGSLVKGSVTEPRTLMLMWIPAVVLVATQIVFLLPVYSAKLPMSSKGRSVTFTIIAASVAAGLLFAGFVAALSELIYWLRTGETDVTDALSSLEITEWLGDRWAIWPFVLASWILWAPLLWLFCRRVPSHRLHGRLVGWLLAGTIVEVLVVLPLDIMVRRKTQCYCSTGTFFALLLSIFALMWVAGPGVVLAVTSKRRRGWSDHLCPHC